ncbi:uncharacterized protein J3R85_005620 [Psidium guajava]|nr:uncharacterized protein J3R85_005620 [Psidium guajava]
MRGSGEGPHHKGERRQALPCICKKLRLRLEPVTSRSHGNTLTRCAKAPLLTMANIKGEISYKCHLDFLLCICQLKEI